MAGDEEEDSDASAEDSEEDGNASEEDSDDDDEGKKRNYNSGEEDGNNEGDDEDGAETDGDEADDAEEDGDEGNEGDEEDEEDKVDEGDETDEGDKGDEGDEEDNSEEGGDSEVDSGNDNDEGDDEETEDEEEQDGEGDKDDDSGSNSNGDAEALDGDGVEEDLDEKEDADAFNAPLEVNITDPEADKNFGKYGSIRLHSNGSKLIVAIRLMQEMIEEVLDKNMNKKTPFTVVRNLWLVADQWSRSVAGKKLFHVLPSNVQFEYVVPRATPRQFHLLDFGTNTRLQLQELDSCFRELVPASLVSEMEDKFLVSRLYDDASSRTSLFEQTDNQKYLKPYRKSLHHLLRAKKPIKGDFALTKKGTLKKVLVESYFKHHNHFLAILVRRLLPILGIPPRAFQAACLQFESTPEVLRSLKIFEGRVLLCHPVSKQNSTRQYDCFWSLPLDYARYLLLFLGVIRPVVIALCEEQVINNGTAVDDLKHFIFASVGAGRIRWTGADVDRHLKQNLLKLDANGLRQVTTGIIRHWFPDLAIAKETLRGVQTTPVDRQGQHSSRVSSLYYARTLYTEGTSFNEPEFHSQDRISVAVQSLDEVVRKGGNSSEHPQALSSVDALISNGHRAMLRAKDVVLSVYGIASRDGLRSRVAIQKECKRLQRVKPFLRGPNAEDQEPIGNWVAEWTTLGDDALVAVVVALGHNFIFEGAANTPLALNYSPKFVATAVYLIECAVQEWSSGTCLRLDWEKDSKQGLIIKHIEEAILTFKQTHLDQWIEFRSKTDKAIVEGPELVALPSFQIPYFAEGLFSQIEPELMDIEREPQVVVTEPMSLEALAAQELRNKVDHISNDGDVEMSDGMQAKKKKKKNAKKVGPTQENKEKKKKKKVKTSGEEQPSGEKKKKKKTNPGASSGSKVLGKKKAADGKAVGMDGKENEEAGGKKQKGKGRDETGSGARKVLGATPAVNHKRAREGDVDEGPSKQTKRARTKYLFPALSIPFLTLKLFFNPPTTSVLVLLDKSIRLVTAHGQSEYSRFPDCILKSSVSHKAISVPQYTVNSQSNTTKSSFSTAQPYEPALSFQSTG
ncbi:hypothetical protein D9757_007821 [Collybiopsis confluens]|uniref:Uncharacterized protein n=1 Tax=Collybiopsis confluens TaxID=2823264 RepID=A0A8H5HQ98_9AGAR|nr:hypothetical protein D9757_007821 [Collybiopsis confluens]